MRATCLLLCVLALPAVAHRAQAEERLTPAEAVLAALPAPAAEHAWEFRGIVLRDGRPYGRVSLSARPHPEHAGHWLARDEIVPLHPQDFATLQTAVLDRQLQARSGTYHRRNTRGFLRARFEATSTGYRLEHEADYYENRLLVPGSEGISTLAGLVTLLRHAPVAPAVLRLRDFDPDPSAGDPYSLLARVQIHGIAAWRVSGATRDAWIVSVTRGKQTLRLAFDPQTRALLGVDYVGVGVQLVPEGSGPVGLVAGRRDKALLTPLERAVRRTQELRDALPVPRRPLHFLGDVRFGPTRVGVVMLSAEPASVRGAPAWRVLESQRIQVGEAVIEHEISGFLRQDLSAIKGERIDRRPEGLFHVTYARKAGGMETVVHTADGPQPPVLLDAPARSMPGLVPALLFLRHVSSERAHYVLPGWDPRFAKKPKAGTGTFTLTRSDLHVEVRGVKTVAELQAITPGFAGPGPLLHAHCQQRGGQSFDVFLKPDRRQFVALLGGLPRVDLRNRQSEGTAATWYDAVEGTPKTWRQAFVKFGRGYHLPERSLLADAFHWPSMVKHALAEGRYAEGTSEAKIRKDWIDVFVGMSKHRTKADCDDLLFQIFVTSQETQHADGSVSLTTLPAYGGHTYRMQELDGRWWIVQID